MFYESTCPASTDKLAHFHDVGENVPSLGACGYWTLAVHAACGSVVGVTAHLRHAWPCAFGQPKHRNVAEQQSTIAELKTTVVQQQKQIAAQHATAAQQQKQIEALTATVQKVSDQVALSKPAPQLVANP